ncbi:MAG: hypothetical protein M5U11_01485 [Anaerolineales bacterium]|jgi:hypothetical protein|nr:hypothetical protein [Anaerolineales bacterium]MDX9937520.1 hypothetical protein [Anaerolineales bacterium]GER78815.1 conserved hypothetical protein [Candidatus Denitrolinea symbiosum]
MRKPRNTPTEATNIEWHVDDPRIRKWIVQCAICQSTGYLPSVSKKFFGRKHLVTFFKSLDVNEAGICNFCQQALEKINANLPDELSSEEQTYFKAARKSHRKLVEDTW